MIVIARIAARFRYKRILMQNRAGKNSDEIFPKKMIISLRMSSLKITLQWIRGKIVKIRRHTITRDYLFFIGTSFPYAQSSSR
jgi:hypothetical protein